MWPDVAPRGVVAWSEVGCRDVTWRRVVKWREVACLAVAPSSEVE
jgi:hypothetical protein